MFDTQAVLLHKFRLLATYTTVLCQKFGHTRIDEDSTIILTEDRLRDTDEGSYLYDRHIS